MQLRIQARPGASKDEVLLDDAGQFRIRIKAPAVDGKANAHLIEFLSSLLSIPRSRIHLMKGDTSKFKMLEIDAPESEVRAKLLAAVAQ